MYSQLVLLALQTTRNQRIFNRTSHLKRKYANNTIKEKEENCKRRMSALCNCCVPNGRPKASIYRGWSGVVKSRKPNYATLRMDTLVHFASFLLSSRSSDKSSELFACLLLKRARLSLESDNRATCHFLVNLTIRSNLNISIFSFQLWTAIFHSSKIGFETPNILW